MFPDIEISVMKRFLVTVMMLFSVAALYAENGEADLIFLDKRIVRISGVKAGETVGKIFRIKNGGTADLIISDYKASCNCTEVKLPGTLAPGQTGTIEMKTDTTGKRGKNTVTVLFEANTSQRDYVIRIDLNIVP